MDSEVETSTERIAELIRSEDYAAALPLLLELHPADQADLIADLAEDEIAPLGPRLPPDVVAKVLEFLPEEPRGHLVRNIEPASLARILDQVESDIAADVIRKLPPETEQAVLRRMTSAPEIQPLLPHEDTSAGGRMTSDFVTIHGDWTAERCISYLREARPEAEQAYYLYVVDGEHRLQGVLSLRHLVVAPPDARVSAVMSPEVFSVRSDADQEEAALLVRRYNLQALPVVDEQQRLVGVITGDDVLDVATEEATEDMYRMVGLPADEVALAPVLRAVRRRMPWLLVNVLTAFLGALTVSAFEDTISKVAALAVFMPVVAGQAGNAGSQTATIVVRSIALGELEQRDLGLILRRQLPFGLIVGVTAGVLTSGLAYLLTGNAWLGLVVMVAMIGNNVIAVAAGTLIPLTLRWAKLDPALSSTIWLTTFTDVMGFLLLLGLGAVLVDRLA